MAAQKAAALFLDHRVEDRFEVTKPSRIAEDPRTERGAVEAVGRGDAREGRLDRGKRATAGRL